MAEKWDEPIAAWCEFDGTPEGCTRVTAFTGGHASGVVRWKTTTYDGGWVIRPDGTEEEFGRHDTIFRKIKDGSFFVGEGKAWEHRLAKLLPEAGSEFVEPKPECDCPWSGPRWSEKVDGSWGWQTCEECPHPVADPVPEPEGER